MKAHHEHLLERMAHKGWSEKDLVHANGIFKKHKHKKHFLINYVDELVHWLFFVLIVFGNLLIAASVVPLLVIFPNPGLYAILIVLGVGFGFLCEEVIRHIDHMLRFHHHVIIGLLIPIIAAIGMYFIIGYGDANLPNIFEVERSPVVLGIAYAIAFMLPYSIVRVVNFFHWIKHKK
jgi:hypothetical protein